MKQLLDRYMDLVRGGPPGLFSRGDTARLAEHVADGLAGAERVAALEPSSIIDIGSGGGVPGFPLAARCSSATVHLVESLRWKSEFLAAAATSLDLDSRVKVHCVRAEEAGPVVGREACDVGVARALATPPVVAEYLSPLVRVGGHIALWTTSAVAGPHQGAVWLEELGLAAAGTLPAPSPLRADGVILLLEKVQPCADRFPRRTGVAARRPLT